MPTLKIVFTNFMFFCKDLLQAVLYIAFRPKPEEFIEMANCVLSESKVLACLLACNTRYIKFFKSIL